MFNITNILKEKVFLSLFFGAICKSFGAEGSGGFRKKQYLCGVIAAKRLYEIRI